MEFTFTFCPSDPKQICQLKKENCKRQHAFCMIVMDQNTEQRDLGKTTGDQMIETDNREKSIKCNQCDFASSQAGDI